MKRFTTKVQCDECPACHQAVLTAGWDDLWGVQDSIVADPTPLSQQQEMACVLLDRARYILEMTAAKTFRLSRITADMVERQTYWPSLRLPAHRCQARFPEKLPIEVAANLCPVVGEHANVSTPPF